jgi:plastocyanin
VPTTDTHYDPAVRDQVHPVFVSTRVFVAAVLVWPVLLACGDEGDTATPAAPTRSIDLTATEYEFNGDPGVIAAGDTVEFAVENVGRLDHSLEVLSSSGSSLGRTRRIAPGSTARVTVTFDDAGVYRLICDVDDHLSRRQTASISVG